MFSLTGGANQQFTAAGLDQYSNEIPQLAYIWESSGGDLTNAGLFTALGTGGIYEVVARATSKDGVTSGSARVEIPPGFSNFSDMSNINLIGDAEKGNGDVLRFPAKPSPWEEEMGMVGAAWFTGKQLVRDSFETAFEFQITELSSGGGAGFAFVVQNTDPAAIGLGGDAIGYQAFRNNIAVEFDTDRNDWTSDPDGNHISVHTRGTAGNLAQETHSIGVVSPNISMSDGKIHAVKIEYSPGTLSIYLDDLSSSLLQISLDIADTLALDDGKAWVGFTGSSNGPVSENHDILSWTFTPVIVAS